MPSEQLTYEKIEAATCRHFRIGREQLRSPCRDRRHMQPRWVIVYLARQHTKLSYPELANRLCRDHTSIITQERRALAMVAEKNPWCENLAAVEARLAPATPAKSTESAPAVVPPSLEILVRDAWRANLIIQRHMAESSLSRSAAGRGGRP